VNLHRTPLQSSFGAHDICNTAQFALKLANNRRGAQCRQAQTPRLNANRWMSPRGIEAALTNRFAFIPKEQMMKKSVSSVLAVLLASTASLAVAQTNAHGSNESSSNVSSGNVSAAPNFPQVANCDPAGCWGIDGTRYTRGAGDVMFGSNGKTCQLVAPGAPLSCN